MANRATHALVGRHAVLPTESAADFDNLLANLVDEWHPKTETESQQVDLLALHWWRLLRIARLENDALTRPLEIRHQLALTDEVERISRYEVRIRRAYHQAIETLRKLQSARRQPAASPRESPNGIRSQFRSIPHRINRLASRHRRPILTSVRASRTAGGIS